jgi:hypothetical protein
MLDLARTCIIPIQQNKQPFPNVELQVSGDTLARACLVSSYRLQRENADTMRDATFIVDPKYYNQNQTETLNRCKTFILLSYMKQT